MYSIKKRALILPLSIIVVLINSPLQAQQKYSKKKRFIEKGTILTTFSFSFTNGSRSEYNQDQAREVTGISFQIDGLYFISDRIGIGSFINYSFAYRDLFNVLYPPNDLDERSSYWIAGIKVAYYIPFTKIFEWDSNNYLLLDYSLFRQQSFFKRENGYGYDHEEFGYQIGTGLLIPIGKQIAINTKLRFRSYRREYVFYNRQDNLVTNIRWPIELSISVGLNITF